MRLHAPTPLSRPSQIVKTDLTKTAAWCLVMDAQQFLTDAGHREIASHLYRYPNCTDAGTSSTADSYEHIDFLSPFQSLCGSPEGYDELAHTGWRGRQRRCR